MRNKRKNVVNDKPFAEAIIDKARRAVDQYRFSYWREEGRFVGQCVELDTLGVGDNPETAVTEARELAVTSACVLLEQGKRLPIPASSGRTRTLQINIRLSAAEKQAIEEAAKASGFRGISDFLRIRGLSAA